ncbi:MAG: glutamate--cysteine ligase [Burkholderiales bacterium]|nr:glutamate--cysteine ligase [Burkholderiales bacterium]PZN05336.1 MAG: glutamate--cysteine ligase [Pseudomonadota bacterium]
MSETLAFTPSQPLTLGIELELQLVNTRDYNLTRAAPDLLAALAKREHPGEIKPEITESMIEISTGVCDTHAQALHELNILRALLADEAERLNIAIAGGGTHPFQKWSEQRIYDTPRFLHLQELYGYLAKQFTVFGQHVHIGVPTGDEAVRVTQLLSRYVPHFIALSASSPYSLGADTQFDSSRLNVINAFPLSGFMPFVEDWAAFNRYFETMRGYGIVKSMKDFYWDIRPKPEYGTIELRVCDTPLTIQIAADLAAYAQALCAHFLEHPELAPDKGLTLVYTYNKFQACRFGLEGTLIDPATQQPVPLAQELIDMLATVMPYAVARGAGEAIKRLMHMAAARLNGARTLREVMEKKGSLNDVVREASRLWMQA